MIIFIMQKKKKSTKNIEENLCQRETKINKMKKFVETKKMFFLKNFLQKYAKKFNFLIVQQKSKSLNFIISSFSLQRIQNIVQNDVEYD